MRKIAVTFAMLAFVAGRSYATSPGYPITGSQHDFTATGEHGGNYVGANGQTYRSENRCTTCHAPHKARRNYPLWGRNTPDPAAAAWNGTSWIVWGASQDGTDGSGKPVGPVTLGPALETDVSLKDANGNAVIRKYLSATNLVNTGTGLCMSCHDGTLALMTNTGGLDSSASPLHDDGSPNSGANMANWRGRWGRNLSDMHPVGLDVPFGTAGWQASLASGNTYSGSNVVTENIGGLHTVGCTSCHSMHSSKRAATGDLLGMKILRPAERCLSCHDR